MSSDKNNALIKQICQSKYLSDDKIGTVYKLSGYVLMGFLHPEDLAQELKEALQINPEVANPIANTLNDRIFSTLRADIDKIYEPPTKLAEMPLELLREEVERVVVPKPIFITPSGESAAEPPPVIISGLGETPMKVPASPTAMPGLESELQRGEPAPPEKAPAAPPATGKPLGEFARLETEKRGAAPAEPPPTTPQPTKVPETSKELTEKPGTEPSPAMIFGETETKPSGTASRFRPEIPPIAKISEVKTEKAPPRPAVFEFSGMEKATPPAVRRVEPPPPKSPPAPPRVVHYGELRTPLIELQKEIKPPVPPPPATKPAAPPTITTPPVPAQQMKPPQPPASPIKPADINPPELPKKF